jgi:hypothetical protein
VASSDKRSASEVDDTGGRFVVDPALDIVWYGVAEKDFLDTEVLIS